MGKILWTSKSSFDIGWVVVTETGSFGDTLGAGQSHEIDTPVNATSAGFSYVECPDGKCPAYALASLNPPEGYDLDLSVADAIPAGSDGG